MSSPELWNNQAVINRIAAPWYNIAALRPDLGLEPGFELPVHNQAHGIGTGEEALEIAANAAKHGVTDIETDILRALGSLHDAGFALRPMIDHNFSSKELCSSDIARKSLPTIAMPASKVDLTCAGIESTAAGVKCTTNTARCFRQADLKNVRGDAISFLNVTYRLFREKQILEGKRPTLITTNFAQFMREFVEFGGISHEILSTYLEEDISLGDFDRDANGRSLFAVEAAKNVDLLVPKRLKEILPNMLGRIVDYQPVGV